LIILQHTLLLDNFPANFMMAQVSLPIKTKRHSIANLLACTRSDYNARPGAFFFTPASGRYLPETKTTATPIAMPIAISCYYYERRRPDSHHAFFARAACISSEEVGLFFVTEITRRHRVM
jgi:hypothetical protein